jgi:uncharacterized protein (DUF58 family)
MVTDVFAGQYESVFKGRGMEFDEVREYQPGDEIRSIDWNVTARMGHPYVKKFIEERQLTVMILLDASASCRFGSTRRLKSELAAELSAVLAFSAIHNNDRVGLVIFTEKIEKFIPPRKGVNHVLRVIREALYFKPSGKGTDINSALEYLNRVISRRAVVFVISDFYAQDYKKSITITNKKHDVIALTITDPREHAIPNVGIVDVADAETGKVFLLDASNKALRARYAERAQKVLLRRKEIFDSSHIDHIDISSDRPYMEPLIQFFRKRERRI